MKTKYKVCYCTHPDSPTYSSRLFDTEEEAENWGKENCNNCHYAWVSTDYENN